MNLKNLIDRLKTENQNKIIPVGFNNPHSHRGDYSQLAFERAENITIGQMLECAESSLGKTFEGYKGGEFLMSEYTDCYIAEYGSCGEEISSLLLDYMTGVV